MITGQPDVDLSIIALAAQVLHRMRAHGWTLAVAEGDSGGLLSAWLTSVPGCSAVIRGGVVAYHDDLKVRLLGVEADSLAAHGAVSGDVALAMARGVRVEMGSDIGLASTGVAGPGGGSEHKPVGLTWVAVVTPTVSLSREYRFSGDRAANRRDAVTASLGLLLDVIHQDAGALAPRRRPGRTTPTRGENRTDVLKSNDVAGASGTTGDKRRRDPHGAG